MTVLSDLVAQNRRVVVEVTVNGEPLPIIGGDVTYDADALIRRSCSLTLATPRAVDTLEGGVIVIRRGMRDADGEAVLADLGTYDVSSDGLTDSRGDFSGVVAGFDQSRRIARNRWVEPYVIADGTNAGTALAAAVLDRFPGARLNFTPTTRTLPSLTWGVERDHDPLKLMVEAARSVGFDLFMDRANVVTFRPTVDPDTTAPQWVVSEFTTLKSISRRRGDDQLYTRVIVTSSAAGDAVPVRAEAIDADLETRVGVIPYFMSSPYITTEAQAQDAAAAQLLRVSKRTEVLEFSALPNPEMDVQDVVAIDRQRSGINTKALVTKLKVPLDAGSDMVATTSERRS